MTQRETVRFSGSVAPDSSEQHTKTMEEPATVEEVEVRFYRGPELQLEVEPFALVGEEQRRERRTLVDLIGRDVIVGDADSFPFRTRQPVERDEEIGVTVTNTTSGDDAYAYDFTVDMTLDYEGGTGSGLVATLQEVLA